MAEVHTGLARQQLERRAKIDPLHFHYKTKDIAAFVAAEVMPDMLVRAHHEAWRSLIAERAQPFIIPTGTLKLDVLTDDVLDI